MNDQNDNILNEDLGGVDISFPVLPKDTYLMTVKEMVKTWSKKVPEDQRRPGTENMINVLLKTVEPATSTTGQPVAPGFPVRDRIMLSFQSDEARRFGKQKLATFRQAVTGTKAGAFEPLSQYVGKNVRVTLKVEDADGDYEARNAVARYEVQ